MVCPPYTCECRTLPPKRHQLPPPAAWNNGISHLSHIDAALAPQQTSWLLHNPPPPIALTPASYLVSCFCKIRDVFVSMVWWLCTSLCTSTDLCTRDVGGAAATAGAVAQNTQQSTHCGDERWGEGGAATQQLTEERSNHIICPSKLMRRFDSVRGNQPSNNIGSNREGIKRVEWRNGEQKTTQTQQSAQIVWWFDCKLCCLFVIDDNS